MVVVHTKIINPELLRASAIFAYPVGIIFRERIIFYLYSFRNVYMKNKGTIPLSSLNGCTGVT